VPRYTFGIPQFGDGIDFAVIAMGIFGIGETILNLERSGAAMACVQSIKGLWRAPRDLRGDDRAHPCRGTLLGSALGILPGGGPVLASLSAYALEKKSAKQPER
jgi:putative tricarboxylic transport membrane protein